MRDARKIGMTAILLGALGLQGCSDKKEEFVERPVHELYREAHGKLGERQFLTAAKAFEEVERQHPYSTWAVRAQLMSAYAHYRARRYDDAIATLTTFTHLHPAHQNMAYVYYLLGLCYYDQIMNVERSQEMTDNAIRAFTTLIQKYPGTTYARDAQIKLELAQDHLAGHNMAVGRYYLKRKLPIAALNRFLNVIQDHQTTSHVPEALYRVVEANYMLNMLDEAQRVTAVLGYNYGKSIWYAKAYALLKGVPPTDWAEALALDAPADEVKEEVAEENALKAESIEIGTTE